MVACGGRTKPYYVFLKDSQAIQRVKNSSVWGRQKKEKTAI